MSGEYDLIGNHPESEQSVRNVEKYQVTMEDLKALVTPELELIESRILAPLKDLQGTIKTIQKTITKRQHKVSRLAALAFMTFIVTAC